MTVSSPSSRTTLRNDDVKTVAGVARPVNDAVRTLAVQFAQLPRREQAWLRFTLDKDTPIAGQTVRGPAYSVAAFVVLAAQYIDSSVSAITAAPWLNVTPAEGIPQTYRVENAFGLPTSGTFDVLVEFVENVAAQWPRTDVTGGTP